MPRVARAVVTTVRDTLVVALACSVVHWVRPNWTGACVASLSVVLVACCAWRFARARRGADPESGFLARLDQHFGLRDQLRTWGLAKSRPTPVRDDAVHAWLERSLERRLATAPIDEVRAQAWPSWRRVKLLAVVFALLVLLRLLLALWPVPPAGPVPMLASGGGGSGLGGGPGLGGAGDGQGESAAGGQPSGERKDGDDEDESEPDDEDPPSLDEPVEPPDEPPPPPDGGAPDPDDQPPRSLRELGIEESFLLPGFVGEGEAGEGVPAAAGEVEREDPESSATPSTTASDGAGAEGAPDVPPRVDPREFERAAERATRARHVPLQERGVVRAWFEALRKASRSEDGPTPAGGGR